MTKTTTYKCDVCQVSLLAANEVIGVLTNRTDGLKYPAAPPNCHSHVCKKCADAISMESLKAQQSKLDKIQEWYETADRSAHSWAELDKIMENQDD